MNQSATNILLKNLNTLLKTNGFSQTELARKSGIAQKTVNNLFRSSDTGTSPKVETVERIAEAFGITVSELLSPNLTITDPVRYTVTNTLPKAMGRLIEDFLQSDEDGQKRILLTAQTESERSMS